MPRWPRGGGKTVAPHSREPLRPGSEGSGWEQVRRGASGSCPGALPGAFGAQNQSSEPSEERFGAMFDSKTGRHDDILLEEGWTRAWVEARSMHAP